MIPEDMQLKAMELQNDYVLKGKFSSCELITFY